LFDSGALKHLNVCVSALNVGRSVPTQALRKQSPVRDLPAFLSAILTGVRERRPGKGRWKMLNFEPSAVPLHPMHMTSARLSGGDRGVEQTIDAMKRLIQEGKKDPLIHECAANILRNARVPAFDWHGEIRAIGEWVSRNVRFTRDVYGKETLHSAREIVRLGIGDCDDFTILICALLGTVGVKTRIVTISSPRLDLTVVASEPGRSRLPWRLARRPIASSSQVGKEASISAASPGPSWISSSEVCMSMYCTVVPL